MTDKKVLRRRGRQARRALTPAERDALSLEISARVAALPVFRRAAFIGCYLPAAEEVNTWPVIERAWRMNKRIFVPVLEKQRRMRFVELLPRSTLEPNPFGLLEPRNGKSVAAWRLDLVLVPLVAFDTSNNRIGMGGGYYDRAFSFLAGRDRFHRPKLVGLGFACQQVGAITASPWDIPLFAVCSENGEHRARPLRS